MSNRNNMIPIPGRLHSVAVGEPVSGADEVLDDALNMEQSEINQLTVGTKNASTGTTGAYPYNGMGRVVLHKNMVNGVNTLTQDMLYKGDPGSRVPNTNTIFVIQCDFTLGEDITVPANCVLEFDGGSINGGTILFQNTKIIGNALEKIIVNIDGNSTFNNKDLYIDWFTNNTIRANDCSYIINKLIEISQKTLKAKHIIKLLGYIYHIQNAIVPFNTSFINIEGVPSSKNRYSYTSTLYASSDMEILFGNGVTAQSIKPTYYLRNLKIDANYKANYAFCSMLKGGSLIENVSFINSKHCNFYSQSSYIVTIKDCFFEGLYSGNMDIRDATKYNMYLGGGTCNAWNIKDCWFEAAQVGILIGNGYDINISGCTIEGLYCAGIVTTIGTVVNIDGCYFENNGECRNINHTSVDSEKYVGLTTTVFNYGKDVFQGSDEQVGMDVQVISNHTINSDIIIGASPTIKPEYSINSRFWLKNFKNDISVKNTGLLTYRSRTVNIINCSSTRVYAKTQNNDTVYYKNPSFVTILAADGVNIKNNHLFMQDPTNITDNYGGKAAIARILCLNGHVSCKNVCIDGNVLTGTLHDEKYINFYDIDQINTSIDRMFTVSEGGELLPEFNRSCKTEIKYKNDELAGNGYYNGNKIFNLTATGGITFSASYSINAYEPLLFTFYAKGWGNLQAEGGVGTFNLIVNGDNNNPIPIKMFGDTLGVYKKYSFLLIPKSSFSLETIRIVNTDIQSCYISDMTIRIGD